MVQAKFNLLTCINLFLRFWPIIDDALRKVAIEKNVTVKLLISHWKHSRSDIDYFLHSLTAISDALPGVNIEVVSPAYLPKSHLIFHKTTFTAPLYRSCHTGSGEDPVCPGQPQQVHGDRQDSVYRDFKLVRRLFHGHSRDRNGPFG